MEKIINYFSETLPKYDSFYSLLIFLLIVFGGLYLFFQLIFKLGDTSEKRKKEKLAKKEAKKEKEAKEKAKKEAMKEAIREEKKTEPVKKENEEKHKKVVEKKEKHKKEKIIVKKRMEDDLVFLEEEKPYVETRPYYSHERNDSYIVGMYDGEYNNFGYGENYLHNYFNDERFESTVNPSQNIDIKMADDDKRISDFEKKSDELINTYKSLPSELKQYIINKLMRS